MRNQDKIYSRRERLKLCYMVMQDVNHQLFTESVLDELFLSMSTEDQAKAEAVLAEMDLLHIGSAIPWGCPGTKAAGGRRLRDCIGTAADRI